MKENEVPLGLPHPERSERERERGDREKEKERGVRERGNRERERERERGRKGTIPLKATTLLLQPNPPCVSLRREGRALQFSPAEVEGH